MGHTAVEEDELTEFEMIEVESIKAVPMGANGFPHLIMKGIAIKGGRDCPGCGKSYDADSKAENCENCGRKLPAASDGDSAAGKSTAADVLDEALKAVKAVRRGKVDEAPDVDLGKQILVLLGKAIENEAQEIAAGFGEEVRDVSMLTEAAQMVQMWVAGEQTAPIDGASVKGAWSYPADDLAKADRKFSEDDRKRNAKEGNALPDGSYPIPDKDALRRAAILARSGHGNVAAAKRLIARRAKELGVPNPLDDDKDGSKDGSKKSAQLPDLEQAIADGQVALEQHDGTFKMFIGGALATDEQAEAVWALMTKGAVAPDGASVQTGGQGDGGQIAKAAADAVTKAIEPLKAELADLRAFKARVEKLPVPGGPVLSAAARPAGAPSAEADDLAAKAALYRAKADAATTPADREGYRQLAREYDDKAAKA